MSNYEMKQCYFLQACGFDTSNGFWQEDVNYYKNKYPEVYIQYMM